MKYILLLLGVAQATPSLRRKLQSITWDVDGVEQTAPCDTPGAVHAAMCGRALSDAPCDTSVFEVGSVHAMNSGSCMHKARWYRVAAGDSDNTRKIFRCGPDEAPICAKDGHTKTSVDPAADCNTAYADKDAQGNPLGHYNWDVGLLCSKNAGADLTAGGSSSSGPTNCHGIGDGPTCDGEDDCAWGDNECHFSASSDSGPSCPKTVVADFQAGDDTDYTISIDGATAQADPQITLCEGDTLNVTRPDGFTGHPLRISDTDGNTVLESNRGTVSGLAQGNYPYKCTVSGHESMSGIVKVLSTSDPECSCDSSSSDDSGPSHACDTVQCPTGFTQRSSLPTGDNPSAKHCCRPMRKGCKTSSKWTYDVSADVHDDSLCVDAQTATEKDNEVGAASGYDAKRNVHKKHAKEAFYKERLTKSKKAAIRAARATISDLDLPQRVKDRKKGTVKVAVAINDADDDSCEVGAQDENCASLDLADEGDDETTILMTEGDGKWAVVVDGNNVIVKQKRNGATFDMQCWTESSWGTAEEKDPSTDASIVTHKCGSHVFMVGSLQEICADADCAEGTSCNDAGVCVCDTDVDCAGTCGGSAVLSGCDNTCGSTAVVDCAGTCGGSAVLSGCDNTCGSTAVVDCAGTCGGSAVLSGCDNTCGSTAVVDCAGTCGGSAVLSGCDNTCGSTAVVDCAGTCGGSAVLSGCDNTCGSTAVVDCAGTCGGSAVLSGCDNTCGSTAVVDCAGTCGGSAVDNDGNGVCDEDETGGDTSDPCDPAPTNAKDYINNQCCQCPSS